VIEARWIRAIIWTCQLVAYQLELLAKLTHDQVSNWLAVVGASTRRIPIAIEVVAIEYGITHFLLVPKRHAGVQAPWLWNMSEWRSC
jgi:hypothetical protein